MCVWGGGGVEGVERATEIMSSINSFNLFLTSSTF